ncbi:GTPase IMAP family member 9 isoform X3 [Oncorhynchus kisutch]|uniref:GTPase IMAP family member 9 isoform X2 n=1 Tax=Oncorhynchus kisutch TaxID=8019 RepID=UPI0012DC7D6C|nr:GTPase IMAP family member 9-like isoform X2 [Oncorhynchus kisutch]XP_031670191.1 GTPase IMAP family member 9-like isoform X3 [Oncorhynchus kisutch]
MASNERSQPKSRWRRKSSMEEPPYLSGDAEFRVLLFGRSGHSQFSLANSILGTDVFSDELCNITESQRHRSEAFERKLAVVNTPNLSEYEASQKELRRVFKLSVCMSSPGPYVVLFAFDLNNISPSAASILELVTKHFGDSILNHMMVVVCHEEEKEDSALEEKVQTNRDFRELIEKCGRRYHLFNERKAQRDEKVSRQLLEKMDDMVRENGCRFYSNHQYQEAEERIQKEERFMMKGRKKEMLTKRKELESRYTGEGLEKELESRYTGEGLEKELESRYTGEGLEKELESRYTGEGLEKELLQFETGIRVENRAKAERKISEVLGFTLTAVDYAAAVGKGAALGALCGAVVGIEGMVVGAAVGAVVGGGIGGAVSAAWGYLTNTAAQMNRR